MYNTLNRLNLSLRKTAQIDQQTFFDFYGLTLLPKEYLQQNPEVQKYRDVILQIVKDAYVEYFKKDWGDEELAKAPSGAPLVERFKSHEGYPYSVVNIVTCVKRLMETTQPDETIKLIDLINDAEHQTGSYFLYAPQMQQWISQALAIKASQSPQQLLPYMSSDVQDILRDYLKATGQSYVSQQTDWNEAVKYITQNQYETMSYRKQITPEMYEYFKNSPDAEVRAMIVLDDRAPLHIRTYLAQNDQNDYMASNVLLNRGKIPVEVWQALLQNPDPDVQVVIREEQGIEMEAKRLNLSRKASILDEPRATLDLAIWDISDELPKLRPSVKEEIIDRFLRYIETYGGYFEPEKWIDGFYYTGSTATRRYTSSSDVDIHVLVDWNRLIKSNPDKKGDLREMWRKLQDIFWWTLNKETLPGTKHPVTYFVIPPGEEARHLETTEEAYDMQTDKWIVAPKNNDEPPIIEMEKIRNDADEIMNRVDLEIAKTKKGLIDYVLLKDILSDYNGDGEDIKKKIQDKLVEIEEALMSLKDEYDLLKDKRKDGFLTEAPIVDGLSQNWTPGNILFKLVERYKYMDVLRKVKKVLSDKETALTDKEIPSVVDALTPKFESSLNLRKRAQDEYYSEDPEADREWEEHGEEYEKAGLKQLEEQGDEYDEDGNLIHAKWRDGLEAWFEYDKEGNVTHDKRNDGSESWYMYDRHGNEVYSKSVDAEGYVKEGWADYGEEGNLTHVRHTDNQGNWNERWYDENRNLTSYDWGPRVPTNKLKLSLHKKAIDLTEPEDVQWGDKEVHQDWKLQRTNKPRYDDKSQWLPDAEKEHHPGTLKSHRLNLQKLSQGVDVEYDEKGNIIREKVHHEHDKEGNLVYEKWSDGYEARYNYDERRSIIHAKDSDGVEIWFDYDEEGNKTHERWNDGTEYWYDREGNIIHTEGVNEKVQGIAKRFNLKKTAQSEVGITRDEKGNIIYEKPSEETEVWREYDVNKNLIHEKYPSGVEVWYSYGAEGNLIHERWNDGHQFWYDETGNVVGSRYFDGNEWKEIGKVGNKKLNLRKTAQFEAIDYAKSFLSVADQRILDYKMTGWPAERIAQELITQNIPPNRDGNWNQNMINVRWNTVIKPLLEEVTTLPEKRAVPMMHYTPIPHPLKDYIDPNILISVFEARDSGIVDYEGTRDYVHQDIGRVLTKEMWKILQEKHFANRGKQCINNKMAYFDQPKSPYDNRSYLEREPGPPESGQTEVGPGQSEEMGAANDDQWTGGEYDGLTNKPSTPGWTRKPEREKHLPEFNESVGWPGGQVRQVSRNNMIKLAENRLLWTEIINEVFDELLFN